MAKNNGGKGDVWWCHLTAPRERMGYAMGMLPVSVWSGVSLGPLIGGVLADFFGYSFAFFFTASLLFIGGLMVSFLVKEPESSETKKKKSLRTLSSWKHILTAPGVPLVFFFKFISWLSRNVLVPYLPLFVATLLIDQSRLNTLTGLTIALSSAAGTITAILFGRLGDTFGHKKILILCLSLTALCYLPQF